MCLCREASPTLGPAPSCWVPRALASSSPSSANLRPARLAPCLQAPAEPGPMDAGSLQESLLPGAPVFSQPPPCTLELLPKPASSSLSVLSLV